MGFRHKCMDAPSMKGMTLFCLPFLFFLIIFIIVCHDLAGIVPLHQLSKSLPERCLVQNVTHHDVDKDYFKLTYHHEIYTNHWSSQSVREKYGFDPNTIVGELIPCWSEDFSDVSTDLFIDFTYIRLNFFLSVSFTLVFGLGLLMLVFMMIICMLKEYRHREHEPLMP